MSDDKREDGRELGYGNVDSRPKADGDTGVGGQGQTGGGASSGGSYRNDVEESVGGEHGGQSRQGYSGPDNDNATSTRGATHDRAS